MNNSKIKSITSFVQALQWIIEFNQLKIKIFPNWVHLLKILDFWWSHINLTMVRLEITHGYLNISGEIKNKVKKEIHSFSKLHLKLE
jgi:hypothetical protein